MLVAVSAGLRVGAAVVWQQRLPPGQQFGFGDSESYWRLAQAIARAAPYRYPSSDFQVFRAPGYPLLLAPAMIAVAEEPPTLWVRVYSAWLSALGVGGVYWLGKEAFNARTGWLAALGVAFDPGLIVLGALILSDGPFCALLPFQMALWIKAERSTRRRQQLALYFAAGVLAGLATLVRPSWLLFTPLALVVAIVFSPRRRRHLWSAGWIMLGLVIVMSPWWARNYWVSGRLVLTTLQVGASLYDGLNPHATGASDMGFTSNGEVRELEAGVNEFRLTDDSLRPGEAASSDSLEYRLDGKYRRAALDWAAAHPARALELAGVKFTRMWNFWPNEPRFRQPFVRLAVFASFVPVLLLAIVGAWRFRAMGWPIALLLLPAGYFTLLHMIFVSSIRYRLPAMLLLYVLAAAVACDWWERGKTNSAGS